MQRAKASVIVLCFMLAGCGLADIDKPQRPAFWGSKPLGERQSIEAWEAETVPVIDEFCARLSEEGAGEWRVVVEERNKGCRDGGVGREIWGPTRSGGHVDAVTVKRIGDELLIPAGFELAKDRQDRFSTDLFWYDRDDGGFVEVDVYPDYVVVRPESGCRPIDGTGAYTLPPEETS